MKSVFLATVVLFFLNMDAEARRRGVALIGFGEKIEDAADLPDETFQDMNLGYYYNSFRLFFIPVATWDKKWVLHSETEYMDLDEEQIGAIREIAGEDAFKGHLWVRGVNYLWPALLVGWIILQVLRKRKLAQLDQEFSHLQ